MLDKDENEAEGCRPIRRNKFNKRHAPRVSKPQSPQELERVTCNTIRPRVLAMCGHASWIFSRKYVGASIVVDRRHGKHAAKVFFGCSVATDQEHEAKSKGAGCDRTSKKYICRIFSRSATISSKKEANFVPSALVARMILIINSKHSSDSVANAVVLKCCSSCYQRYALCASNFYHQNQKWVPDRGLRSNLLMADRLVPAVRQSKPKNAKPW